MEVKQAQTDLCCIPSKSEPIQVSRDDEHFLPFFHPAAAGRFPNDENFARGDRLTQCRRIEKFLSNSMNRVEKLPFWGDLATSLSGGVAGFAAADLKLKVVDDPVKTFGAAGYLFLAGRAAAIHTTLARMDVDFYLRWFLALDCREVLHPNPFEDAAREADNAHGGEMKGRIQTPDLALASRGISLLFGAATFCAALMAALASTSAAAASAAVSALVPFGMKGGEGELDPRWESRL